MAKAVETGTEKNSPKKWLRYEEAAEYIGWSVGHLRNVVSQGKIPVYGPPYHRRFRADTLDLFIENREKALVQHKEEQVLA